jgi:hypothetical protein
MSTETTIEAIIGFIKVIYPLSSPIVTMDKISRGKYRCSAYMNKHGVPHSPLYASNICNSRGLAFKELLNILDQCLLTKEAYEEAKAISTIKWAEAQIKQHELYIASANRDMDYMSNTIRRLRYLKEKQ